MIILGASGLIGGQLLKDYRSDGIETIATYHRNPEDGLSRFDLLEDDLFDLVPDLGPGDWVCVLSAEVDPNRVADDPDAARALNVDATLRAMETARDHGAGILFLSTESVFDGITGDYGETDPPRPLFAYARQKAEVENELKTGGGKWLIVRTGWTVGWNPKARCPVAGTYKALLSGSAVMAEDNLFTLTDVADTSRALLELLRADAVGIYHVAANPPIGRAQLAQIILETSSFGAQMSFKPGKFSEIPFAEPRPAQAWVSNAKFMDQFGTRFTPPEDTVRKKIALLDAGQQKAQRITA
jgi:dTDP-4-dehydrorhamnose reductase|tara:strand:- start:1419 stop:2315 length:897 start_codon:yes stop_codon:yes gene_type:complete